MGERATPDDILKALTSDECWVLLRFALHKIFGDNGVKYPNGELHVSETDDIYVNLRYTNPNIIGYSIPSEVAEEWLQSLT